MPGYCPGLNPDELLNQHVKTEGLSKSRSTQPDQTHGHRMQPFVSDERIISLFCCLHRAYTETAWKEEDM